MRTRAPRVPLVRRCGGRAERGRAVRPSASAQTSARSPTTGRATGRRRRRARPASLQRVPPVRFGPQRRACADRSLETRLRARVPPRARASSAATAQAGLARAPCRTSRRGRRELALAPALQAATRGHTIRAHARPRRPPARWSTFRSRRRPRAPVSSVSRGRGREKRGRSRARRLCR